MFSAGRPSSAFLVTLAVLVALGHAILAVTATAEKSMTADEIAHLVAGHVYNTRGDYRLQPENGNLSQRWAALPLLVAGAPLPPPTTPAWRNARFWVYGQEFFYGQGLPVDALLFAGRAMIALASAATGLLVFFWSRSFFGWKGAFLSLLCLAFCPTFLAHGALTTSDMVMTFFFLAAVGAWWRHLEHPGRGGAALSAVTFGLACVAKFSAVLLLPMFALIAAGWFVGGPREHGWRAPLLRLARSGAVHVVAAWIIIWLFYGFRFSPFAPALADGASYRHDWAALTSDLGGAPRWIIFGLQAWHLLPDAFLYGFTQVLQFAKQRGAFLNGDYSLHGWVSFFPYAFLVKTPLPFLLLLVAGIAGAWRHFRAIGAREAWLRLRPFTPLAALFVVYWITSLLSHLNIGHRHILPTYPVLFIAIGGLGAWLDRRRPLALAGVAALVGWQAVEAWRIRPHYLAYFNALAGGPANGWKHLVDSSLDWGQDLPGLRRWLDQHAAGERIYLSCFGANDPTFEGIRATLLPMVPEPVAQRPWRALGPGVYAVSATMLQHVYSPIRGNWTLAWETEYQQLRPLEATFLEFQDDPARRAALLRDAPEEKWTAAWNRYEVLRFARLGHYLRVRRAETNVGYSIRVYRLEAAEIAAATGGSIHDWRNLIERAVAAPHD